MSWTQEKLYYFAANKPFGVLSQFTDEENRKTLASLYNFPEGVYSIGRLDMDSEGLLLLTNDKKLTDRLLNTRFMHEKEYYVQIEGTATIEAIQKLGEGIFIQGKKTLPAKAKIIDDPNLPKRVPPIRERKNIPTSWISLTITEGRNRQVRKMTAAVGFPTLRLVRVRFNNIQLGNLLPGEVRKLTEKEILDLKK